MPLAWGMGAATGQTVLAIWVMGKAIIVCQLMHTPWTWLSRSRVSINAHTLDMALKKQGREGGRSLQEEGAGEVGRVEGGGAEEGAGMRNEEGGVVGKAGGLKARGRGAVEAKPEREDKRKNKHINLLNTFLKSMEEKPFHSRLNCTL